MAKKSINLTLNIPDEIAPVIMNNLAVLKNNERLTEFLEQTVLDKLQDVEAIEQLNKKVKLNGYGTMQGTTEFYMTMLERLKTLEAQIEALRYDMHTAAVLADKVSYREMSSNIMSTIDVLFRNLTIDIKLNVSDYVEQRKWLERETVLQQKFSDSLSNFRLLQAVFDDTDIVLSPEDTLQTEETTQAMTAETDKAEEPNVPSTDHALLAKMEELLQGLEDVKYVLRNSTVMDEATVRRNLQFSGTEIEQPTQTQTQVTNPEPIVVEDKPLQTSAAGVVAPAESTPSVENIDINALASFFM